MIGGVFGLLDGVSPTASSALPFLEVGLCIRLRAGLGDGLTLHHQHQGAHAALRGTWAPSLGAVVCKVLLGFALTALNMLPSADVADDPESKPCWRRRATRKQSVWPD